MIPKQLWFSAVVLVVGAIVFGADQPASHEDRLKAAGIEATSEGITKYLEALLSPTSDAEADRLVNDLGNEQFEIRERATQRLAGMPFPPREKLEAAAKDTDLERSLRARSILAKIQGPRESLLLPVLAVVEEKKLAIGVPLLIQVYEKLAEGPARPAAFRTLLALATKDDLPAVREMLKSPDARVRRTGKWFVARLEGGEPLRLRPGTVDAVAVTPGSVSGGGNDLIAGWEFKVKEPLLVTEMGIYDDSKNGLKEAHEVAIWDLENEKEPLVQTTVPALKEAELFGMFRCTSVESVELLPGHRYAIVAHYPSPGDASVDLLNPSGLTIDYAAPVEVLGRRYTFPHKAMAFPSHLGEGGKHATIGPTFRFAELEGKR